jgi:hypothetical protein
MPFTKEQIEKALTAKDSDELVALAQAEGISLTKDEADKYYEQLSGTELSADQIEDIAGGCTGNACAGNVSAAC